MAISSEITLLPGNLLDFRAPPPSPIGNESSRRSSFVNDDVLTEFLEHSLQVPDLILPDRIFPKEISVQNPPEIDFKSLLVSNNNNTELDSKVLESISTIGCFQLINHGISDDLIKSVLDCAAGVFQMSPENKAILLRSFGKRYGFEEFSGYDEMEMSEEFVWCRDEDLKSAMEGIWSDGYSNFSQKLEGLSTQIEKVATEVLRVLSDNTTTFGKLTKETDHREEEIDGLVCCLYNHCRNFQAVRSSESSLRLDVIRMLVNGSDNSHALGVHVCNGASEFHLYSKKGWISFCPNRDAIVVTIGDQIQAWSGGQYKHVNGKPIFKAEAENNISMAFLYSPPTIITSENFKGTEMKTISLRQQFILAIFFTLVYHFILNIF
ncbi:Non-heme dioxygenase N-terminal domain [Macleaya cordata]|uniref:Non-heme dioxygenase N-terminal domain n=1 Tax=Macleaya cordata TaxID=56857 RepID=A0A200RBZ8_MACCD|nr:Non-heme dioxygenase N-terminal domain [Macleaya cordata]